MNKSKPTLMVMGATGMNGSKATEEIVKRGHFSKVIITYFKGKAKAENLVAKFNDSNVKISAEHLNAEDRESMSKALKNVDIVINFIGPYYKFGTDIIKAAIEFKVNYIDICDDCQIFDEVFELNENAKKSDISIICGSGTSPGVTNLIAMYGANKLDRVDDINIWFFGVPALPFAPSVFEHYFDAFEGEVPLWRNGTKVSKSAFSEISSIYAPYFTDKEIKTYLTAHPQPITLPRYIKGVKNVTVRGGYIPSMFMDNIIFAIKAGLTDGGSLLIKDTNVSPRQVMCEFMSSKPYTELLRKTAIGEGLEAKDIGSRLRIELIGMKDNKNVRYTFDTFSERRETTYLTPVIVAEMLTAGKIKTKGVVAVEGIEDPTRILDNLFKEGFSFKQETIEITKP